MNLSLASISEPPLALTYDDVLLVPAYSEVVPRDVSLRTYLREDFALAIPLVAAAMDTVSESAAAVAMARLGGLAVLHKNLAIAAQAAEVGKVKAADPRADVTVPTVGLGDARGVARERCRRAGWPAIPVVDAAGHIVGAIRRRALLEQGEDGVVADLVEPSVATWRDTGSVEDAAAELDARGVERLWLVDGDGVLRGAVDGGHVELARRYPHATRDGQGHLRCAAAIGPGPDCDERAAALVAAGVDMLVIDTAHGHSRNVLDAVRRLRARYPALALCGGNVATGEATTALAGAGVDVVKVGIGPGSICTTRIVAGVGVPQMTAVLACAAAARACGVRVIADGGVKHSGDIVKAMAGGADAVMVGSLLAGTDETPGEVVIDAGMRYKAYRGMGSLGAMQDGSKDRYFQEQTADAAKLVPEGVEARVPARGPMAAVVHQLMGGLRAGMGYLGAEDLAALRHNARMVRITHAGLVESHVHGVAMSRPSPNYRP